MLSLPGDGAAPDGLLGGDGGAGFGGGGDAAALQAATALATAARRMLAGDGDDGGAASGDGASGDGEEGGDDDVAASLVIHALMRIVSFSAFVLTDEFICTVSARLAKVRVEERLSIGALSFSFSANLRGSTRAVSSRLAEVGVTGTRQIHIHIHNV